MSKKSFVLDTNVLIHNPAALTSFADNEVVIPFEVLEELDEFKKDSSDLGRNVRMVIRHLDALREKGRLADGVPLNGDGGSLRVDIEDGLIDHPAMADDTPDNRIISSALRLQLEGKPVVFVSKDINARIKSDSLGIKTMDFEKQKVDFERLYTGYREVEVSEDALKSLIQDRKLTVEVPEDDPWNANEFAVLKVEGDQGAPTLARYDAEAKALLPTRFSEMTVMNIRPRNIQQQMVFELLLDDKVKMVTLVGQAGTGKTLLAVACGLHAVMNTETYEKLLVSRPIMPLGRDIGFLPGSKDEKLANWMQPIFDNLAFIFALERKQQEESIDKTISDLTARGLLELEALTYIRGRSIPQQYLIVDEAQNLTPHEIKTIITRVGEGTKVVLTGDATQIDNPYLDASSNGLSYAVEQMRDQALVGHVTLLTSERSDLASLAAQRL
ncbi:MAG: PhoH family protein [Planctomycetes bacterium]|nr:PhoH family protein [Planctomycetota bacterium]